MSQIELAEVLKAKLAKLEQLYRSELDRTNQESEKNFLGDEDRNTGKLTFCINFFQSFPPAKKSIS